MSVVVSHLKSLGIPHRFILSGSKQQLILFRHEDIEAVNGIIDQWRAGDLASSVVDTEQKVVRFAYRPAPLTLLLIFLGFTGAALVGSGREFIHPFTFWDASTVVYLPFVDFNPWADIQNGELWRLVTPAFLHFGPVHIIFNALWIWYLGSLLEFNQGRWVTLMLFLVIAVVSNSAQAFASQGAEGQSIVFGGLSGVVHGLFAYCWLWGKMNKTSPIQIPAVLFIAITVLMLLSPLGIFDIIVGGEIADTAHISGYITGALCALGMHLLNSCCYKVPGN